MANMWTKTNYTKEIKGETMPSEITPIVQEKVQPLQVAIEYGNGVKEMKIVDVVESFKDFYIDGKTKKDAIFYYVYTQYPATMMNEIVNAHELNPMEINLLNVMFQQLAGAIVALSNFDRKCLIDGINLCVDKYLKDKNFDYLDPVSVINYYRYNKNGSKEKFIFLE